jgi:hypothetical protein
MPPGSEGNRWGTTASEITFLAAALDGHDRVAGVERTRDVAFHVRRAGGLSPVVAVLLNRETISLADAVAARAEFPDATCIVAPFDWCGYTREARRYALEHGVGIFTRGEFLSALRETDPHRYEREDPRGEPDPAYHDG